MSKILCLGGAGFIGSHLVERLLADGNLVCVIDDFSMGKLENLPQHTNLAVISASILDDIDSFFEDIDTVFHLAALTRPQESIQNPLETTTVNVEGTLKVLLHCRNNMVRRLVFTSSTSLYGTQEILPTPETATPNPMSPYALTKIVGEQYCRLFGQMYDLEINYIRPFNVYGSRQDPRGGYAAAVPKFIDLLSKDKTPYITGDGEQSRDFVYVSDVVDLMVKAAETEIFGETFNAGSGTSTSINDLYKLIAKLMDKDTEPNHVDPVFEPPKTLGDITKAEKLLGWKPKVSLEEGLRLTIEQTLGGEHYGA